MQSKYKIWISRLIHLLLFALFIISIGYFKLNVSVETTIMVVLFLIFSFHSYELRLIKKELHDVSTELDAALNKAGVISLSASKNRKLMGKLNVFDFISALKNKVKALK